ncbi:MAG: nucleotide exchange factor GrpE [Chloroflexi bacterium RBG_16_50_9]|nr:MAG: nucleotide exchange factor GrpE [Chloroflexi bacterium RBG_16_50_9]
MTEQESELTENGEAQPELVEGEDVQSRTQALDEARKKTEEYLAGWQRAQADFINYKRRTEQERQDFVKFANAGVILSLLPVLGDLERALDFVPADTSKADSWVEGVRLVYRKFKSALEAQGATSIKALGEPFDPNFHEAVRQSKGREGLVVEELEKGYMLHDRLLRPARVVVGNGSEEEKKEET